MRRPTKEEQRALALWAIACARRVLPYFRRARPADTRLHEALATLRTWLRTGVFSMRVIRRASLSAHAAARDVADDAPACAAARSAGQAVATAHVPEHALGAAYYALKAVAAADPAKAGARINREIAWQTRQLPTDLRPIWQDWLARRLPKNK